MYGRRCLIRVGGTHAKARSEREKIHNEFRIPAGSRKAMLVNLALQLWKAGRLDLNRFPEARGRGDEITEEEKALRVLVRSSAEDREPAVAACLNGDTLVIEGRVRGPARALLEELGADLEVEEEPAEEKRYLDMTPFVFVLAALVMGLRYISLGLDDRMLYVFAGLGFAFFYGMRPFLWRLQRPRSR
jgi:hypothetical protein